MEQKKARGRERRIGAMFTRKPGEKICSMQRESWKTPTRAWRKSGGESALRIRDTVNNISSVQQRSAFRNRRLACGTRL